MDQLALELPVKSHSRMSRVEYLLNILVEELAEVQQACTKIVRFTPHHSYDGLLTNLEKAQEEYTQVLAVIQLLEREGINLNLHNDHQTEVYLKKLRYVTAEMDRNLV